jgi:hypothetical protein
MATAPRIALAATLAVAALAAVVPTAPHSTPSARQAAAQPPLDADELEFMGYAGHVKDSKKPKVTAYFLAESYRPGQTATLVVRDSAPHLGVQLWRAGTESEPTKANDVMLGSPVAPVRALGPVHGSTVVSFHLRQWPSGVYFARLTAPGRRVGYAPFVLGPRHLGEHRVAVVLPTETWQAYNFRDDDGDGQPDTWYAGWKTKHALLVRPFLDRGVPPHWKNYDAPFVRWLDHTGRAVDFLSDADLRGVHTGRELADAYSLLVFSGHHEYVTTHEYDVVRRFRDLGGNLAFLSANNFFWKITLRGDVMTRVAQWRDLGRPEAALIGVQYRANDRGESRGAWIMRHTESAPWLFRGTDLGDGSALSKGGIEIDASSPASPRSLRVLAEIPNIYGPGYTAQMTYYATPAGAKVFAAGAFSLADCVWQPDVSRIVENLLGRLSRP